MNFNHLADLLADANFQIIDTLHLLEVTFFPGMDLIVYNEEIARKACSLFCARQFLFTEY